MDNFTFHNPTRIIFGKGAVGQIGGVMKEAGVKRVLLVAGGGSIRKNGVYDTVTRSLTEAGVAWVEAWGVRPNPVLAKAREIIAQAQQEKVDAVLAVGGGSVIDTGKSVAAGVFFEDLWAAFERQVEVTRALPIFVVLTMSGTGSEMDPLAVLTHEADLKKWVLQEPGPVPGGLHHRPHGAGEPALAPDGERGHRRHDPRDGILFPGHLGRDHPGPG